MTLLVDRTRPAGRADAHANDTAGLEAEIRRLKAELAALRAEKDAIEAACHEDPLTELLNRRGFLRELDRALSFARRYDTPAALLLVDLDRFKPINDRHGHEAGDRALKHVAGCLQANLRGSDLIGRLGGDEFAILVWQVDQERAEAKARALEAILSGSAARIGGIDLSVEASIGVAMLRPEDDQGALLARADRAMYVRKAERRALRRRRTLRR